MHSALHPSHTQRRANRHRHFSCTSLQRPMTRSEHDLAHANPSAIPGDRRISFARHRLLGGGKSYKGFSRAAVTATLLAAIAIGQLGITISANVKSVFFLLFL